MLALQKPWPARVAARVPARRPVRVRASQMREAEVTTHANGRLPASEKRMAPLQKLVVKGMAALLTAAMAVQLSMGAGPAGAQEILELPYYKPEITTQSDKQAKKLVDKLNQAGAKMYGAFWCSHCFSQKQLFGKEVETKFPYVECYPDGWQRGATVAKACSDVNVRAFPSWVINERLLEGELTMAELQAELDAPVGEPSPTDLAMQAAEAAMQEQALGAAAAAGNT